MLYLINIFLHFITLYFMINMNYTCYIWIHWGHIGYQCPYCLGDNLGFSKFISIKISKSRDKTIIAKCQYQTVKFPLVLISYIFYFIRILIADLFCPLYRLSLPCSISIILTRTQQINRCLWIQMLDYFQRATVTLASVLVTAFYSFVLISNILNYLFFLFKVSSIRSVNGIKSFVLVIY